MGLFTGIGDFFRGVFGENDDEKRQRKQREAQQAAQRTQQQAAQQKLQQQQVQNVGNLFGAKPAGAPPVAPTPQLQQTKKPPVPAPTVPKPLAAPPTQVDFKKLNASPAVQPQQFPKGKAPAPGSAQDVKNRIITSVATSPARVLTGLAQAGAGAYDLATPGKGNNRVTNALTKSAEDMDAAVKKEGYDKLYKTLNVPLEIGTYFIPTTVATKVAAGFPKATKLTAQVVDKAASLVDDAGEAGKLRQALAEGVRKGLTLDQVLAENAINLKYTGEQTARGEKVTPRSVAENTALSVAGATAPAAIRRLFRGKTDALPDEAAKGGTTGVIKAINDAIPDGDKTPAYQRRNPSDPNAAQNAIEQDGLQKADEKALEELANDPNGTALDRKNARDELDRRKQAAEDAAFHSDPLNKPAYQAKQEAANIVKQEEDKLTQLLNASPELTQAQREEAIQATRDRIDKLVGELKANREAGLKAVDEQGQANTATVEAGQKAAADAQATAEAKVNPAPETVVQSTPTPASPEAAANNAYSDYSTRVVNAVDEGGKKAKHGNILYTNPVSKAYNKAQQAWYEFVGKGADKATDLLQKGVNSSNTFNKGTTELGRLFFKNFAQKREAVTAMLKRTSQIQNAGRVAVVALKNMEDAVRRIGDPQQTYERIYRVLETPEYLARRYGDATKLTVNDLTPEERVVFDKLIELNKIRNDINYETGLINADQHAQFADGMHSPRIYDIDVQYPQLKTAKGLDLTAARKRKDLEDVPDYIFNQSVESPFQASALRLETALKNKANLEAFQNLNAIGGLPTTAPNNNYTRLVGKKYGQYEGRYIDKQLLSQIDNKDYYNSQVGQALGDAINTFHNSALGAPGRAYKKFRTVLSPGTIVGNIGSGQFAFSKAVGINPLTSMGRTAQAAKQLNARGIDPHVQEAELAGLFSGDTGRMINNTKQVEHVVGRKDNAWDKAGNFYGGIDRATALGWYNELRARGLNPQQAVERVHLGMQNYANAGRVVGAAADAPILGKPFARFTPELLRIFKNAAIYNPVGTGLSAAGLYAGANKLSDMAGETPEERKTREEAPGQTKIGNLSLNLPIGDSQVNIARAIGLNFPQEPNGSPESAIARQLNPFADPTRTNAQGETVIAPNQLVGDMFYRQIADQIANRDFMGREITDPENKTYYEDGKASIKKFPDDLTDTEKLKNRARAALQGAPFAPEADNLISAIKGNEDYYGKERTIPQAIGRLFGVKVENNDKKAREKRVETNKFFDEDLPAVQKFVTENPDLAQKYYQIKNPTRGRKDNTKTSDLITPEKWDIINSDTSGRLFNFMKSQEQRLHDKSFNESLIDPSKKVKPIDPIYQLPPEQAKQVAELRSRPSGDDIEAQDILRATSTWYAAYEDKYHDYLTKNGEYYKSQGQFEGAAKDNPRVKEYNDASVPVEQPAIIKEYYKIKAADPERAKEVYKANKEALSAAFDSYASQRLDRINKMRKIEGYDPISLETYKNKTFGFDVNDDKGRGYGYSRSTPDINTLGELTNFTKGVDAIAPIEAQAMPQLAALFNALNAGSGGSHSKPKIGASSKGR